MAFLRKRVCVASSAGGHLSEALAAVSHLGDVEKYFVTCRAPHVLATLADENVFLVTDPHVSVMGYLRNTWQSIWVFARQRPRVIVTTGAGMCLATCVLGRLFGSRIVFVESGARVVTPSRTGRLVYRFADVFVVQWRPLLKHYPGAVYGGPLL